MWDVAVLEQKPELRIPKAYELLRHCYRTALESDVDGMNLEFGTYKARSTRICAGIAPGDPIFTFDSFEGLPEDWHGKYRKGSFCRGIDAVKSIVADYPNIVLVPGWFEDSIAPFMAEHQGPAQFINVDCDIYSAAKCILATLDPWIVSGTIIYFDELFGYDGFEEHEHKAFNEWLAESGKTCTLIGFDRCCAGFRVD